MIVPLYILLLGIAAGITGIYTQHMLHPLGYVPDLQAAIALTAGAAAIYLCIQLLFFSMLKLFRPSQGAIPYVSECLSQLGALLLLLPVLGISLSLPHPALEKAEPFLFLGAFVILHGFFKLLTLFSATQTEEGSLGGFLGWGIAAGSSALVALIAFGAWQSALLEARRVALEAAQSFRLGDAYVQAQAIEEGAIVTLDLPEDRGAGMLFRWAPHPELSETVRQAWITLEFNANPPVLQQEVLPLNPASWQDLRLDIARIPEGATHCSIQWFTSEQPAWIAQTGLRPPEPSDEKILLAGPHAMERRAADPDPDVIIIALDGLGQEHIGHLGYNRNITPGLDALAAQGLSFDNMFTPAAEGPATIMSLFTGMPPLQHGYLAGHTGNLSRDIPLLAELLRERGYFTGAFTEGARPEQEDLPFGSGFERGMGYYDPSYPMTASRAADGPGAITQITHAGSKRTLDKAQAWIAAHNDMKYMAFIRLTELQAPRWQSRHGLGFAGPRPAAARPIDRYDTMLQDVDQHLDAFLREVRAQSEREPLIVVMGSYGLDFTEPGRGTWRRGGPGVPRMGESSLRVPLILAGPGVDPGLREDIRSLLDLTPTLHALLGLESDMAAEGQSLLHVVEGDRPISVMGNPVSLSLRSLQWRYIWHSGRAPFTREMLESPSQELIDVIRLHNNIAQPANVLSREASTVNRFRQILTEHLESQSGIAYTDN